MKRAVTFLLASSLLVVVLGGREARGERSTCIGDCRTAYGMCFMNAKNEDPSEVEAARAACGRAYVDCAKKCRAGGAP
jgi:hypothetical protein